MHNSNGRVQRVRAETRIIAGQSVRMYSLDGGHTWASRKRDLGAYYRRALALCVETRRQFKRIDTGEERDIQY